MRDPVDRAVRAIALRNSYVLVWAQFGAAHLVFFAGLALLTLYVPMKAVVFWELVAISQALVSLENLISIGITLKMWRPVRAWERGARDEASTVAAWTALATLPLEYMRRARRSQLWFSYIPFIAFTTWRLHLHWYWGVMLAVVGTFIVLYGVIFRYFMMEVVARPVLEEVAKNLPDDFKIEAPRLPLRWRLFAVAPVINIGTGVLVSALAGAGHHQHLSQLGLSWVIAVGVSFTISLELVLLSSRSLLASLRELQEATERVRAGDFNVHVPVVTTDEVGELVQSFNTMVDGLDERERLRAAFGAYVDPSLAERVLREGADLAGEELTVTVLFLDIRNFTAFAERARPHEVVALLNDFWERVVPILLRHRGHANKFIGDGLLGVFGAPERLPDHAERAVRATLEIVAMINEHYRGEVGVGVGVNTGRVVAGTVGGGGRVEFTVIGDTVNTAARVEAATRKTGDDVLITEATRARLPEGKFEFAERVAVPLKGKTDTVRLWTVQAVTEAPKPRVAPAPVSEVAPAPVSD